MRTSESDLTQNAQRVVFESTGQVRDLSGRRVGDHDPAADAKEFRALCRYVGDLSRGRVMLGDAQTSADAVTLAAPQGELGQSDVQTQGTFATSLVGAFEGVADIVCPVTLVKKTSGTWLSEDVAQDLAQPPIPQVAATAVAPALNPKLASKAFDATATLALAVPIPSETFDSADLDMTKLCVRRLVNAFKLDREVKVAALLTTAGSFASANQHAATVKWNGTNPLPLTDVFAGLLNSFAPATHIVMTEPAARWFFSIAEVYQYLAAGGPLPRIVVARAKKVVSAAAAYVWGAPTSANATLVVAPEDAEAVSTARTFRYIGDAPDKLAAEEANGYLLRSFFHTQAGPRGTRSIVLACNEATGILSNQLGGIITGVLA